jgi:outer membrane protein
MKKVIFTLVLAVASAGAFAQIEQGTILVGASSNGGFNSYNEDAGDFSEFNLDVKGGYFVIENLALGLNIGFEKNSEADDASTSLGLFGRYYVNGKIFGGVGFTSAKSGDFSASVIPIEVGYAAFLGKVVAIEPALSYSIFGGDAEGAAFGLNVGLSIYLNRGE